MEIYVDTDACPVKDEALKVAERYQAVIYYVSNSHMRLPQSPLVRRVVVESGADSADDWIAERIGKEDIAVTADIPLASRCLAKGARAVSPTGKPFTESGIGMALAMRDLSRHLRETGQSAGSGQVFTPRDRSRFLEAMEQAVQQIKRCG